MDIALVNKDLEGQNCDSNLQTSFDVYGEMLSFSGLCMDSSSILTNFCSHVWLMAQLDFKEKFFDKIIVAFSYSK